jgi:two-component system, NarL family, sensor kinase
MFNKHQEVLISLITGVILILFVSVTFILSVIRYRKKEMTHYLEKQKIKSEYQETLLRTQLEIQEQTLKTISQEIHDNIGQVLSLAKLNLNTVDLSKQDELQDKITDSKNLVSKAIQDLRDLSKSMNTDNIEAIGFIRAIEYEMDMIRKTGFKTQLDIEGKMIRLEPQKELILFRIIQEVLNNIMKHAEANAIEINVNYTEKEVKISVSDNGKGFDLTPLNENDLSGFGLGIRNMHNRAKLIGADFSMSSNIGNGTVVSLAVPLNNHNL